MAPRVPHPRPAGVCAGTVLSGPGGAPKLALLPLYIDTANP